MELENEQESNDLSSKLSDISENEDELPVKEIENEDELPVKGIANLYRRLSNKIESSGGNKNKISEDEDELPVKGIASLYRKLSNKNGNEGEIKSKKLDLPKSNISENFEKDIDTNLSNKNTDGNEISNLSTDKTSNSVLSDVSKNESDEDEPGLILSDDEEKVRKQNHPHSTSFSHDIKERHLYDYKPMCPPRFTTNIYRSESNYPDAFNVRERITSKDGGSYVRYYTQNAEYDDSSYFSQSEPSAHRDYSEELEYYKYRDHKRRDESLDREYYDDQKPEKRRDHKKKKRRKDREASDNDDLYEREKRKRKYEKHGSYDYDERSPSKHTNEAERKSRRRRRKSSSHEEMSDDSCIIEEDLRDVKKKRSKKGKKNVKEICLLSDSSEDDYEKTTQDLSEERNIKSKKEFSRERSRKNRSKGERSLERTGHKSIDSGQKRISDEHKISEHRKEKKHDRSKRIDRETESLSECKEKTLPKSENASSTKNPESNYDAALWVTLQNMAKLHNEKYKEYKNNPLNYPNYKEEYDMFSKLHKEKKSEFGECSKELDLDQEWELYWPKRLNEIVKEKWVVKKQEFIQNQNSMKLHIEEQHSSSVKPSTKENNKSSDNSKKDDDNKVEKNINTSKKITNHTQLSAHSSAHVKIATKVSNIEMKPDLVIETVPVNKENCLQQSNSNSSHSVNQSYKEVVKNEVLEKNVSSAGSTDKGKVSTVDDGIVWLLRFLLTLKKYLASLIGPIEGLYNEAIEFQNKGVSPIKILEDSGHKMVLQLVVNKFVTIINSNTLSIGEKTLYGKIMEQLNNLIKGGSQINSKQQVESKDKKMKGDYNPIDYNRKAQIEPQDNPIKEEDHRSYSNHRLQVESQENRMKQEYHTSTINEDPYVYKDYNHKRNIYQENIPKEHGNNFENYDFQDYNHRLQVESQENRMKQEYHTSTINENPYVYKDYNHKRNMYQENIPKEHPNDFENHMNYHGVHETKQILESQDLNDEEIDHIARKTMGRNSDEMIKFIENSLAYKGINVECKEKLRSIFMSVREKQFGIIGS